MTDEHKTLTALCLDIPYGTRTGNATKHTVITHAVHTPSTVQVLVRVFVVHSSFCLRYYGGGTYVIPRNRHSYKYEYHFTRKYWYSYRSYNSYLNQATMYSYSYFYQGWDMGTGTWPVSGKREQVGSSGLPEEF
eukprot:scaffold121392_cov16-Prasinocladus_malaysianus.AAC.1